MLEVGRRKPAAEGAAPISWVESPAAPLAGPLASADGSFDVVTCQQGLQFLLDRLAALTEMRRTLRPGGCVGVAVWGQQSGSPGFAALGAAVREILGDEVADRFAGGPWGMPQTADLTALLGSAEQRLAPIITDGVLSFETVSNIGLATR